MNAIWSQIKFVWFLVVFLLACCSSNKSEVRFSVQSGPDSGPLPTLSVTFRDNWRVREVDLDSTYRSAGPFSTSKSGELEVVCWVLSAEGIAKTRGNILLPLREDWRWGVDFFVSSEDPTNWCFGCIGSEHFALDPTLGFDPDKKLYVVWGGNSISNPVVY